MLDQQEPQRRNGHAKRIEFGVVTVIGETKSTRYGGCDDVVCCFGLGLLAGQNSGVLGMKSMKSNSVHKTTQSIITISTLVWKPHSNTVV